MRDGQRDDVVGRVSDNCRFDLIDTGDCYAVDGCDDIAGNDPSRGGGSVVGDLVDYEGTLIVAVTCRPIHGAAFAGLAGGSIARTLATLTNTGPDDP